MFPFMALLAYATRSLARRFAGGSPWPLLLVLFNPAVLTSPNVMRDVPALALATAALASFVQGVDEHRGGRCALAALLAGLAFLTKYSALMILGVLALYAVLARRPRCLAWLLVTAGVVALWCLHNRLVHGRMHVLFLLTQRTSLPDHDWQEKLLNGLSIYGASLLIVPLLIAHASGRRAWPELAAMLAAAAGAAAWIQHHLKVSLAVRPECLVWCALGAAVAAWLAIHGLRGLARLPAAWREPRPAAHPAVPMLLLAAWGLGPWVFTWKFVPFQAVRHLLLALPPAALLLAREFEAGPQDGRAPAARGANAGGPWSTLLAGTLLVQAALGYAVAAADAQYAAVYREFVRSAVAAHRRPGGPRLWFAGHWGLQEYALRHGLTQVNASTFDPQPGDLVLTAEAVDKGIVPPGFWDMLELVETREWPGRLPIRTLNWAIGAGFYAVLRQSVPYVFSNVPFDKTYVYRVVGSDHIGAVRHHAPCRGLPRA